jgi:hypothetical protein
MSTQIPEIISFKKIEINAQHHMFKGRLFDWYHFEPLLVFAGQSL